MSFLNKFFTYWYNAYLHRDDDMPQDTDEGQDDPTVDQNAGLPNPDALLPWDDLLDSPNNHHNVRALCDLEGLTFAQKEVLTACVKIESDFRTQITHPNFYFDSTGVKHLGSTDYGICQWNSHYHGSEITPDQALNNPEMAVRLMCKYWLAGRMSQWVSYSSGAYKQWLNKV